MIMETRVGEENGVGVIRLVIDYKLWTFCFVFVAFSSFVLVGFGFGGCGCC